MTGTDVPAEAVRVIALRIHDADCHVPDCQYLKDIRGRLTNYLAAAVEAGWVLVPGPVRTEWATTQPGSTRPEAWLSERSARAALADQLPEAAGHTAVVSRQVTEWRPAPESTPDGDPT